MNATKAHAAGGAAVVATALGLILVKILERALAEDLELEIEGAIYVLLNVGITWLGTYFAPANRPIEPTNPPAERPSVDVT